ncbi:hypothetical protein Dimus_013062, partial [Dionaea muscipula]
SKSERWSSDSSISSDLIRDPPSPPSANLHLLPHLLKTTGNTKPPSTKLFLHLQQTTGDDNDQQTSVGTLNSISKSPSPISRPSPSPNLHQQTRCTS